MCDLADLDHNVLLTTHVVREYRGAGNAAQVRCNLSKGVVRRLTGCRYACIGCPWLGPAHEGGAHEAACAHPGKSAADVVATLAERDRVVNEANAVYNQVLDLLSYEKIAFNGKLLYSQHQL